MFLQNKYSKWYFNIIKNAISRECNVGYTETHHIVPKSMGGNNASNNLVILTAREHFICHLLLTKITVGSHQKKKMSASHTGLTQSAETIEKRVSKIRGKASPTKGTSIHNDESKNKIAKAQKDIIDNLTPGEKLLRGKNSFHRADTYTEARSKNISKALIGKAKSKEHRGAMMKIYKFISPQGEEFIHLGLATGCAFHSFNYGSVKNNLMNGEPYKGWKILYGK